MTRIKNTTRIRALKLKCKNRRRKPTVPPSSSLSSQPQIISIPLCVKRYARNSSRKKETTGHPRNTSCTSRAQSRAGVILSVPLKANNTTKHAQDMHDMNHNAFVRGVCRPNDRHHQLTKSAVVDPIALQQQYANGINFRNATACSIDEYFQHSNALHIKRRQTKAGQYGRADARRIAFNIDAASYSTDIVHSIVDIEPHALLRMGCKQKTRRHNEQKGNIHVDSRFAYRRNDAKAVFSMNSFDKDVAYGSGEVNSIPIDSTERNAVNDVSPAGGAAAAATINCNRSIIANMLPHNPMSVKSKMEIIKERQDLDNDINSIENRFNSDYLASIQDHETVVENVAHDRHIFNKPNHLLVFEDFNSLFKMQPESQIEMEMENKRTVPSLMLPESQYDNRKCIADVNLLKKLVPSHQTSDTPKTIESNTPLTSICRKSRARSDHMCKTDIKRNAVRNCLDGNIENVVTIENEFKNKFAGCCKPSVDTSDIICPSNTIGNEKCVSDNNCGLALLPAATSIEKKSYTIRHDGGCAASNSVYCDDQSLHDATAFSHHTISNMDYGNYANTTFLNGASTLATCDSIGKYKMALLVVLVYFSFIFFLRKRRPIYCSCLYRSATQHELLISLCMYIIVVGNFPFTNCHNTT